MGGCVTSLEDGDEDRGDGLAALAVTRAGYGGHGPAEYAQAVPAPQSVGDAAHSPCEGAPYKLRRNEERPRSAGGTGDRMNCTLYLVTPVTGVHCTIMRPRRWTSTGEELVDTPFQRMRRTC